MWRQYDQYPRLWLIGWALSNGVNTDKKIPICYKFEKFFMVALVLAFLAICQKSFSNNPSAGSSWIYHSLCPTAHLTGLPQIFVILYLSNISIIWWYCGADIYKSSRTSFCKNPPEGCSQLELPSFSSTAHMTGLPLKWTHLTDFDLHIFHSE